MIIPSVDSFKLREKTLLFVTTVFCMWHLQVKDDTRRVEVVLESTTTTILITIAPNYVKSRIKDTMHIKHIQLSTV